MPPTRRALLAGAATAASAALAGCSFHNDDSGRAVTGPPSTAWPTRFGDSSGTAANDVAGVESDPIQQWPDRTLPQYEDGVFTADGGGFVIDTHTLTAVSPDGSVRWRSDAGYYGPVVLADDVVVAEEMDGGLVGLDRSSGERAWTTAGGDPEAVAGGAVVATIDPDSVAALTPGGDAAWSATDAASYAPVTAAADGTIVAAFVERYPSQPDTDEFAERSTVVAYDAESGAEQWRFALPGTVLRVAVRDGGVHVGANVRAEEGPLGAIQYVLSLADGHVESRYNHPGVTLHGLAVSDEHAFAVTGTTLRAFGSRLEPPDWEVTLPSDETSLAAAASAVYVTWPADADDGTVVAALDAANGEEQWRRTLSVEYAEVVGVTDGRVFVETSGTPGLYVLG